MSDKKKKKEEEPMNIILISVGFVLLLLVLLYIFRESLPEIIGSPFIEFHKMIFGSDTGSSDPLLHNSENTQIVSTTPATLATPATPASPAASMSTAIVPVEDSSQNLKSNIGGSRFKMK